MWFGHLFRLVGPCKILSGANNQSVIKTTPLINVRYFGNYYAKPMGCYKYIAQCKSKRHMGIQESRFHILPTCNTLIKYWNLQLGNQIFILAMGLKSTRIGLLSGLWLTERSHVLFLGMNEYNILLVPEHWGATVGMVSGPGASNLLFWNRWLFCSKTKVPQKLNSNIALSTVHKCTDPRCIENACILLPLFPGVRTDSDINKDGQHIFMSSSHCTKNKSKCPINHDSSPFCRIK